MSPEADATCHHTKQNKSIKSVSRVHVSDTKTPTLKSPEQEVPLPVAGVFQNKSIGTI